MSHPRHDLDPRIHTPVRFSLMAALAATGEAEFKSLKDTLEVSESLLSQHMRVLEEAGYVRVRKGHVGRRPRTWLSLTADGHRAFAAHWETLAAIAATSVTSADDAEAAADGASDSGGPAADHHHSEAPESAQPNSAQPNSGQPNSAQPDSGRPDSGETTEPGTASATSQGTSVRTVVDDAAPH